MKNNYFFFLLKLHKLWFFKKKIVAVCFLLFITLTFVLNLYPHTYEASGLIYIDPKYRIHNTLAGITIDPNQSKDEFLSLAYRKLNARDTLLKIGYQSNLIKSSDSSIEVERKLLSIIDKTTINYTAQKDIRNTRGTIQTPNTIKISYQSKDPKSAQIVTQLYQDTLINFLLQSTHSAKQNTSNFIEKEIDLYKNKLNTLRQEQSKYQEKYLPFFMNLNFNSDPSSPYSPTPIHQKIAISEAKLNQLYTFAKTLEEKITQQQNLNDSTPINLTEKIRQLENQLNNMLLSYTPKHPDIINLKKSLDQLKKEHRSKKFNTRHAADNLNSLLQQYQSLQRLILTNKIELNQLKKYHTQIKNQDENIDDIQYKMHSLNSTLKTYQEQFEHLLSRQEKNRLSEAIDSSPEQLQIQIIDPPNIPHIPIKPNKVLLLVIIFGISIATSISYGIFLTQINPKISLLSECNRFDVRVLGNIPVLQLQPYHWTNSIYLYFMLLLLLITSFIGLLLFYINQSSILL